MDNRHLRASSPPRRYPNYSNRNSTGILDLHPSYDQYGNPRPGRDVAPIPRPNTVTPRPPAPPPRMYREPIPPRGGRIDDYDGVSRRHDPIRRPLSVTPTTSSAPYRTPITNDKSPQLHSKPWTRDDDYYVLPSSSRRELPHYRNISLDGNRKRGAYLSPARGKNDRSEQVGHRSSYVGGSRQQYHDIPPIRPPNDKDDTNFGYEYTDFKEQVYRDTAPRPRARRTSDLGSKERPHSITGIEDTYRPTRGPREGHGKPSGPPVSTRGFSKIDKNGNIRHEYRYPRDPESARSGDESDTQPRRALNKPLVSLHQEKPDGYTSNTEERVYRDRRPRHRAGSIDRNNRPRTDNIDLPLRPRGESHDRSLRPRTESIDRTSRRSGESFDRGNDDRTRYTSESEDNRRKDYRDKRNESIRSESEDHRYQRHPLKQHRDSSQDRYKTELSRRDEHERDYKERKQRERGYESERDVRHRDRNEDHEKTRDEAKKDKYDPHYGTGAAIGAAGAAATGLLGAKHRYDKDKDKASREVSSDRNQREVKSSRLHDPSEVSRSDENSDEERERRRRRRELKDVKELNDSRPRQEVTVGGKGDKLAPSSADGMGVQSYDRGGQYVNENHSSDDGDPRSKRPYRKQSERIHSSSDSETDEPARPSQVQVVSPAKKPEIKPKGILRPPREKFPEDPAPVREGVAPLKDAGKKGIPPNARWTKIDRRLVNPEALELGNERFEERLDYVIVLRVLSKEEIEAYAQMTMEIRERRHEEANKYRLPAPSTNQFGSDEDEYDEYDELPPKAIEERAYNGSEAVPSSEWGHERIESHSQLASGSGVAGPVPLLAALNPPEKDPSRPELYASNSYHRMPPSGLSATSAVSPNAYPPPPPQAMPPGAYPSQQPVSDEYEYTKQAYPAAPSLQRVTGEYTQQGYPTVPPPSQPVYAQPGYQHAGAVPPAQTTTQPQQWQPLQLQPEAQIEQTVPTQASN